MLNEITRRELLGVLRQDSIKEGRMIDDITQYLSGDDQWAQILWYVSRLDSVHNYYKVESHAILTRTLFLMYTHEFLVDFEASCISYVNKNDQQIIVKVYDKDDLGLQLYMFMEQTKYSEELSYRYDFYRQATRAITDHLEEDHDPRDTWYKILNLTKEWFEGN